MGRHDDHRTARASQRFVSRARGHVVGRGFLDYLVDESLILELKAVEMLAPLHVSQVLSYLRATGLPLALLINFNVMLIRNGIRRVVLTHGGSGSRAEPPNPLSLP
jgi:GxxExxY protein